VRFYEWAGRGGNVTLMVPRGALSATLANLMEKQEGAPLELRQTRQVIVPVTPFQIQTVIVRYSTPNQNFLAGIGKP
jgi:hypothetical protein